MTAKPTDINKIFASNAPATSIRDPDIANAGKYQLGWVNERPPYQTFNYAQNKVDRALSHINEYGVSEWDSETSYPLGGWARSTVDGNVYVSLTVSNQNNEPSASSSQWISLYSAINNISSPAGSVMSFASSTPPSGWVECDGSALSRPTYADLFTAIGTTYGTGDGSATFNIPDFRGEFLRGWDNGRGLDQGRTFGSSQGDAIRNITGQYNQAGYYASNPSLTIGHSGAFYAGTVSNGLTGVLFNSATEGRRSRYELFDASRVVPTAPENRPTNKAIMYCIKY